MLPDTATILLVDDSADDRFLFHKCWSKAGIPNPLVELEDGQQAIDHLSRAAPPDLPGLVILDLKMPARNGFEVLAWMRADAVVRRVPVIIMTASEQPGDVEKAYNLGVSRQAVLRRRARRAAPRDQELLAPVQRVPEVTCAAAP